MAYTPFKMKGISPMKDTKGTIEEDMMHQIKTPHKDGEHVVPSTEGKEGDPEAKVTEKTEVTPTTTTVDIIPTPKPKSKDPKP